MRTSCHILLALAAATATLTARAERAEACGCLSPPAVEDDGEYAVNQQAEQIIFEVEEAHVSAHVMIRYAGNPESFAWLLPVPNLPELALSNASLFGLIDRVTQPQISVRTTDLCPQSSYRCAYHPAPVCGGSDQPGSSDDGTSWADGGLGSSSDARGADAPAVDVLDRQTVGNYETIVFSAGDSAAAVAWLVDEGFIVNQTMAPFMQPYADAGMLFVAAKLVPGASVNEIQPLRIRYQGTAPMIPLKLTAVAAEPHMTITSYIFGKDYYRPLEQPMTTVSSDWISQDTRGRTNYPMALARAVDAAGGDAFVAEYRGAPQLPDFDQGTGCCSSDYDLCGVQWDGVCSCPNAEFDAVDCERDLPELLRGVQLLRELNQRHTHLTRLTTRLSAEEMLFDPMFGPDPSASGHRLSLQSQVHSLDNCEAEILEPWRYQGLRGQRDCSALYCGSGECVVTAAGAGCACGPGTIARPFTDLDGESSVTCVPDRALIDLEAGGLQLRDACAGVSCGAGSCVDLAGVPTCACPSDYGAAPSPAAGGLSCEPIMAHTDTPGAQRYTDSMSAVAVCAPAPPVCGDFGWLESRSVARPGLACASSIPNPTDLVAPGAPTCADLGLPSPAGCVYGCQGSTGGGGKYGILLLALAVLALTRRRA